MAAMCAFCASMVRMVLTSSELATCFTGITRVINRSCGDASSPETSWPDHLAACCRVTVITSSASEATRLFTLITVRKSSYTPSASSGTLEKMATSWDFTAVSTTMVRPVISATWAMNSRMGMAGPLTVHDAGCARTPDARASAAAMATRARVTRARLFLKVLICDIRVWPGYSATVRNIRRSPR